MSVTQRNGFIAFLGCLGGVLTAGLFQSGCGSCEDDSPAFVIVEVRDAQSGDPLENAILVCQTKSGNEFAIRTGPTGFASCNNVEPVRIRVSREGYRSRELDVDVGDVDRCGKPEDGPLEVDIALEPVSS